MTNGRYETTLFDVRKTAAHQTWEAARSRGTPYRDWQLNRWADKGAKWAAAAQDVTNVTVERVGAVLAKHKTVLRWLSHVTELAHDKAWPDHDRRRVCPVVADTAGPPPAGQHHGAAPNGIASR